ncbi:MAG TPA: hypothetical protein VN133_11485 [Humibacter sp.]|jgi:hypothetical protein|nr:hypothetical protein [Humibacter sp.]
MPSLAVQLADSVTSTGVRTVYGDPVELDGVTLIPVALAQFGFGAGEGPSEGEFSGGGGGGGGVSVPIGAYVRDHSGLRFEPNPIALLAVGIPFVWVAGRALRMVIRALKKRR